MQRILVVGNTGQLAMALQGTAQSRSAVFLGRKEADLSNQDQLRDVLAAHDFDILINTAAYTAVDKAEEETETANQINGAAVQVMAEICDRKNAVLVHISTDYVFGAGWNRPLKETDPTAPINAYGKSKWLGEEAIRGALKEHIIIRTSWLFGLSRHNFPKTMLRLAQKSNELKVVYDQTGNPTLADDLARAIWKICGADLTGSYGTYHFSNEGVCSWFDFAREVFKLKDLKVKVVPVTSEEFPTAAVRPHYSVLDKKKIKDTFGFEIRHWQEALTDFLNRLDS